MSDCKHARSIEQSTTALYAPIVHDSRVRPWTAVASPRHCNNFPSYDRPTPPSTTFTRFFPHRHTPRPRPYTVHPLYFFLKVCTVVVPKNSSLENSFSIFWKLYIMLLVVFYERKNIIFQEKNFNLT